MFQKFPISFNFHANIPIWRIWLDEPKNQLLIEQRGAEQQAPSFSMIDLATQKMIYKEQKLPFDWWASIGAVWNGKVVGVLFYDNQNPLQQGFVVYDIARQEVIWEKGNYSFYQFNRSANQVVAYANKIEPIRWQYFGLDEGQEEEQKADEFTSEQVFAINYEANTLYFEQVATFIEQLTQQKAQYSIDYLEYSTCILIGYYNQYQEYCLLVSDLEGKLLAWEKLYDASNGIAKDNFFVFKKQIFVVKNKIELVSYDLNGLLKPI